MQSVKGKKTDPEQILIEGAKRFIESFKTPELAMKEAVSALYVIDDFTRDKINDKSGSHFFFIFILENIISAWVKADPAMINDMAAGFKELYEYGGPTYFYESFIDLLTCQIYFEKKNGGHIDDGLLESMCGFRFIGDTITEYSDAIKEKNRKAA